MDQKFERTDLGNAQRLVEHFGDKLRWSGATGWFHWDGKRWHESDTDAFNLACRIGDIVCNEATTLLEHIHEDDEAGLKRAEQLAKWGLTSCSEQRIKATLNVARAHYDVQMDPGRLDPDKDLLNTRTGILDLKTGTLSEHTPLKMMTHVSRGTWDEKLTRPWKEDDCPRFTQFLSEVFDGSPGLIQTVQQCLGYSLSGLTTERCIFLCYGTGANGKSTLLNLFKWLLGSYAGSTPAQTLMNKKNSSGVGDDLAALANKRMVLAFESEGGDRIAEALVKRMTGGDPIACRKLYKEWFEFTPEFKIWLATNHKPELTHTDPAIRARIKMIPFNVEIPRNEWDPMLLEKLQNEAQGVLRWAVEGYQQYVEQAHTISWSREVIDATDEYFSEQDLIGQFIDTVLERGLDHRVASTDAYKKYREWVQDQGYRPLGHRRFSVDVTSHRGIKKVKSHGTMFLTGVRIYDGSPFDIRPRHHESDLPPDLNPEF